MAATSASIDVDAIAACSRADGRSYLAKLGRPSPRLPSSGAMKRYAAVVPAVLLALSACKQSNGVTLGLYLAEGTRVDSCGDAGVLGSTPSISWRVHLRRVGDSALHWNHGDGLIIGKVDAEDHFALSYFARIDMRQGDTKQPTCLVERLLTIEGDMWGATGGYEGFDALLQNQYAITADSSCDDLLDGPEAIADEMPCVVSYEVEAERE